MVSAAPRNAAFSAPSISILMKSTRASPNSAARISMVVSATFTFFFWPRPSTKLSPVVLPSSPSVRQFQDVRVVPYAFRHDDDAAAGDLLFKIPPETFHGSWRGLDGNHQPRAAIESGPREHAYVGATIQHYVSGSHRHVLAVVNFQLLLAESELEKPVAGHGPILPHGGSDEFEATRIGLDHLAGKTDLLTGLRHVHQQGVAIDRIMERAFLAPAGRPHRREARLRPHRGHYRAKRKYQ